MTLRELLETLEDVDPDTEILVGKDGSEYYTADEITLIMKNHNNFVLISKY